MISPLINACLILDYLNGEKNTLIFMRMALDCEAAPGPDLRVRVYLNRGCYFDREQLSELKQHRDARGD